MKVRSTSSNKNDDLSICYNCSAPKVALVPPRMSLTVSCMAFFSENYRSLLPISAGPPRYRGRVGVDLWIISGPLVTVLTFSLAYFEPSIVSDGLFTL